MVERMTDPKVYRVRGTHVFGGLNWNVLSGRKASFRYQTRQREFKTLLDDMGWQQPCGRTMSAGMTSAVSMKCPK